jgi:osmotically-inducible protein OsmY
MTRLHLLSAASSLPRCTIIGLMLIGTIATTGCTTNYLTNSTQGTYGVPVTERTIPQRLLDRSIEHTAKINAYGLQENLQQNSRLSFDSFYSEVLLSGEVPTAALKLQIAEVVNSMPDVRRVYNELNIGVARGYSSTVQDGYISSKLLAKVAASNSIKVSQIKVISNDGVVYVMGRMTPTQQSHLIDIANSTVGITELVLLTLLVSDRGVPLDDKDIMFENPVAATANLAAPMVTTVNWQ